MAIEGVKAYRVYWSLAKRRGHVTIEYASTHYRQDIESPQEMLLVLDILRNEKPIRFSPAVPKGIFTGPEPVGEEET